MRLLLLAGTAFFLSGCVIGDFGPSDRYQEDFHYTFNLQPGGRVALETFNGSVEITGWDENKVEVTGTKYASTEELRDGLKIETHEGPDYVDLRTARPSAHFGSSGARYTLRVPRGAELGRITTSNGAIRIQDVAGAQHLKTSNGSIRASNVGGSVEARTSNNSIELEAIRGDASMKTSNGRIHAERIDGNCEAETSNNSITLRLENSPVQPVRLSTSNGSVDLTLLKAPRADIRVHTTNSSIEVHLPPSTSARLTADTSNNSITSDFELTTRANSEGHKSHLEGVIGSGGPSIDLSTSNGHIRITKGSGD